MSGDAQRYVPGDDDLSEKINVELLNRQINMLNEMLMDSLGEKQYKYRVKSLKVENFLKWKDVRSKINALHKLVLGEECVPCEGLDVLQSVDRLKEQITDMLAERVIRERINKELREKIRTKQDEYFQELKMEILRKYASPETPFTLKKYALLEKMEQKRLNRSIMELLRPSSLDEIVGQQRAVKALISKIASPYPQHVLIYGPPGVGKTTAARLALEVAKRKKFTPFSEEAKFIEVDGTTLRWDPRGIADPLIGSVHDPIYQGSNKEFADTGISEPKPGLVSEAHGGILFIDEIGEMDSYLQGKLLKVLEDKRVEFSSIYYDPSNKNIPLYIKKLFEEGAPADFILIGATTRRPEEINPALRSRCAEVFFEPLTPGDIVLIIISAAKKLGVCLEEGVPEIISHYTIEGRKAINILADAYSFAINGPDCPADKAYITREHVYTVAQTSRLIPYVKVRGKAQVEMGRVLALGVRGYLGTLLEVEAVAFPAREKGKGSIRFNDSAGPAARDSVFNAAVVIRKITGEVISDYDIHVNCVGGAKIDGPSAGIAIMTAIISAIQERPVRQDIAVTGEISIQGYVKPVGGIIEKVYAAKQSGMSGIIIPAENLKDVPADLEGLDVYAADKAEDVIKILFCD